MKNHLSVAATALLAAMLACSNYNTAPGGFSDTNILSMAIVPSSGSGSFALEITYEASWLLERMPPGKIYCSYVTPDMATMPIGVISPMVSFGTTVTITERLPFSVMQANGVTQPGSYLAGCTTSNNDKASTGFTVTGDTTPATALIPSPTTALPAFTPTFPPITVTGTGTQFYVEEGYNMINCSVPATFSLTVNGDGGAELIYTTREIDTITSGDGAGRTCSWRPSEYTSSPISGRADLTGQTVMFNKNENYQECNGTLAIANGVLSGELVCWRGNAAPLWKFVIP
jgi:hypothetical protein